MSLDMLSEQQKQAAQAVMEWYKNKEKPVFVLAGYAGTGKTFVTKAIVDQLNVRPYYMAYTGKAASVINKYNQVNATTIHSKIYRVVETHNSVFEALYKKLENPTISALEEKDIKEKIKELRKPRFEFNDAAFSSKDDEEDDDDDELDDHKLIVLDECSMVDTEMLKDLKRFRIPILALGDPGQLPPVKGTGALFEGLPDFTLTEIRRQAQDNPIIAWSMLARAKRALPVKTGTSEEPARNFPLRMLSKDSILKLTDEHDIVICWRVKTRKEYNYDIRRHRGFTGIYPEVGEKVIIERNDAALGIFNGQIATVKEVEREFELYIELVLEMDDVADKIVHVKALKAPFEDYVYPGAVDALKPWDYKGKHVLDFGYALTCHKSQGSQWPSVLVIEENALNWPKAVEARAQWLYTAITRAAEKLTIVSGK